MNLIDTHCHLIDEAFSGEVDKVVYNALEADVTKMVLACCDESEFRLIVQLCRKFSSNLFPTVGIHPENMAEDISCQWKSLRHAAEDYLKEGGKLTAVGEIGIDLHWDKTRLSDQLQLLEWQCNWAIEHDLPVLLHIRDAMEEWLGFMEKYQSKDRLRGILHCYSGTIEQADRASAMGNWLFGIGGTLTYKKSQVPEVARHIGLGKIVLETDAPYLAPVPQRGHRNEPAYTVYTAKSLADLLQKDLKEIAERTTENAQKMLSLY